MLKVTVTSPEKCFVEATATHVSLPGAEGDFEIYPNHVPLISLLTTGTVTVHVADAEPFVLFVDAGIVEVSKNEVSILIDEAHQARLDEKEKLLAEQRQCRRNLQSQDKINYHQLLSELSKLTAELNTIEKHRKYRKKH